MERFTLIADTPTDTLAAFTADVREGLLSPKKHVPCHWLYDHVGSAIYDEICDLAEYYPTRAESEILEARAAEIADGFGDRVTCVELGSGSAIKTRLLIAAFLSSGRKLVYAPVDISPTALEASAKDLLATHAALEVVGVVGEYARGMEWMETQGTRERLVLWLGSSVGNLTREYAADFLNGVRDCLTDSDRLLIGIDLRKDRAVLERAYNDAQGVTARFSKNALARINRELGGHFDLDAFEHESHYEEDAGRIAIHLASKLEQNVSIDDLDLVVPFAKREPIHIEYSHKYSTEEIDALAAVSRFEVENRWLDSASHFSLNLLAPK
ncbi:MAG: L-histidine N(alpha)-methyltransferase [Planctomycetes bacterium]|nr:L-histidine N(alpha)-methyltransferase [Planctomycetota bacterium]